MTLLGLLKTTRNHDHQSTKALLAGGRHAFFWRTVEVRYPVKSFQALPTREARVLPQVQHTFPPSEQEAARQKERQLAVKQAFSRCWNSYRSKAWGKDELAPISGSSRDNFGGWGATLVDSLDTLWIMGLHDEFYEAVSAAAEIDFAETPVSEINVFETTIRYLGGFLAAYDLSGDGRLLRKAKEVADMLYAAFDTPNRMPLTRWDTHAAARGEEQVASEVVMIAEIGSLTMEFTRLSLVTGDPKYFDAVQRIMDVFYDQQNNTLIPGMWPVLVNARTKEFHNHDEFTLGAMADSMYEYLPKMHAMLGGALPMYEEMYKAAMEPAIKQNMFRPMVPGHDDILISGMVHVKNKEGEKSTELKPEGQHLVCFVGGMLALGGALSEIQEHLDVAEKLVDGCIWTYKAMPMGIMPERFTMVPCPSKSSCSWDEGKWKAAVLEKADKKASDDSSEADKIIAEKRIPKGFSSIPDTRYVLRPEAIESIFVLYRITGRADLLESAWQMFEAIDRNTRTVLANAALGDITVLSGKPPKSDSMESFWLGETLKYFYLIFSEPDLISLDEYVFNTEAHPFKRQTS
ncbi:glycoside hydrolase family 47 protein [Xylariales sp. PMI_506]|nr:glycoside hydrolase family 47 protein [Xylariales sp. PMI_506]